MRKLTHRKKIISIFIILILISVMLSGLFTYDNGHFYFEPLTEQAPYYSGSYENYTISSLYYESIYSKENATGYLNVSSSSNITTLNIHVVFYNPSKPLEPIYVNKTVNIQDNGGKFYYNGSEVHLPFFYTGHVISSFKNHYVNASQYDISNSMITQTGLYHFHIGKYISTDSEGDIFASGSKQLVMMCGIDPVISYMLGVSIHSGNKSYPVGLIMNLHSTSYIIFPVNWMYVIAVYVVVALSVGFIFIVPAAILLGILAYRKKKRRNK